MFATTNLHGCPAREIMRNQGLWEHCQITGHRNKSRPVSLVGTVGGITLGAPRSVGNSTYVLPRLLLRRWAMDTYEVETDGIGGFVVKVAKQGGKVYLTSPSLSTLSDTRRWIAGHRKSATANDWPDTGRDRTE